MIGVTIGVGEDYKFYAQEAAKRLTGFTGLETHVLDNKAFDSVKHHPIFGLTSYPSCVCWYMKFFLFDFFPEADEIFYFDCDYCAVRKFNPYSIASTPALRVCRDRTATVKYLVPSLATAQSYFNGGFFIANRSEHRPLLSMGRDFGWTFKRTWEDQCIWNQLVIDTHTKVNYLPKIYNCQDNGAALMDSNPFAVHNHRNYEHYKAGTTQPVSDKLAWDLEAMKFQAGLNICYRHDGERSLFLLPDGTSSDGNMWFISNGKYFTADDKGHYLNQVHFEKLDYHE